MAPGAEAAAADEEDIPAGGEEVRIRAGFADETEWSPPRLRLGAASCVRLPRGRGSMEMGLTAPGESIRRRCYTFCVKVLRKLCIFIVCPASVTAHEYAFRGSNGG